MAWKNQQQSLFRQKPGTLVGGSNQQSQSGNSNFLTGLNFIGTSSPMNVSNLSFYANAKKMIKSKN